MYICVVQYVLYFAQFESCSLLLRVNLSINIDLYIQNYINV